MSNSKCDAARIRGDRRGLHKLDVVIGTVDLANRQADEGDPDDDITAEALGHRKENPNRLARDDLGDTTVPITTIDTAQAAMQIFSSRVGAGWNWSSSASGSLPMIWITASPSDRGA